MTATPDGDPEPTPVGAADPTAATAATAPTAVIDTDAQAKADLAAIPKIPYARGLRLSWAEILRISMTVGMLVVLLTMQQPCADAVSKFVTGLDDPPPPAAAPAQGSNLIRLKAGMTDAEMKATLDKARGSATPASP